jgi:Sugar (and other) transporter
MFYAPTILSKFFSNTGGIYGAMALNAVNFLATFITIGTIEKFGRVKLLLTGGSLMFISLIANAILSSMPTSETVGYLVVVFSALFIVGFAATWGPIAWVACSEIFPLRERGKALGLTTFTNYAGTTIVGWVFPMASTASLTGCFGFFAGMMVLGLLMVYFYMPETAGKTILEIDENFQNHEPTLNRKKWD